MINKSRLTSKILHTMPNVTFYYFPVKALGEAVRLLLAYGGQEFEDKRVAIEDWPAFKPSTPFGQMPVLEIDGKKYAQSFAICRYLARKYGLSGSDAEEDFEIDQNVDFLNDIRAKAAVVQYEPDQDVKAKKHEEQSKNVYPALLEKLDEIIKKNNGHIAAGKLTWADFAFAGMFDYLKMMMQIPDLEKKYPSFQQVVDAVYSLPKVKAFNLTAYALVVGSSRSSEMENVVFYYFPFKGMGEGIRMLLNYGGQKFDDRRIPREQWPELKPNTPFGQMPVLDVNGKQYSQTLAIARYLGRNELRVKCAAPMFEEDAALKQKMKDDLDKNYIPVAMKKLNEIIGNNNGYIANGKLSWGDFVIAGVYDGLKNMLLQMPDLDEKYPNVKKLRDNVVSLPKVKEYVATSAPQTPF
ncbi:unnamed protein product [Leptosia nina]|uniref:glutathione transferase n=1 Tax=Leptosia nina TaxID=320188 RepID=A0AAV1K4Q1_9NEOP